MTSQHTNDANVPQEQHMRAASQPNPTRRRSGFTLVEMLVAVGAVLLLALGIGQLFGNVSSLVNTGSAVAEVDQLARAIEKQLRDDFEAMSKLSADETVIIIRQRPGVQTYLTEADEEADEREGISDEEVGTRSVFVRLDEVLFIAQSSELGLFRSAQQLGEVEPPASTHAIIQYGHGLRTRPAQAGQYDPEDFDPDDPDTFPGRSYIFDGDPTRGYFGSRFNPADSPPSFGRNRYAGDWPLLRTQVLLLDGSAMGYADTSRDPIIGADREFALYARDYDATNYTTANGFSPALVDVGVDNTPPFVRIATGGVPQPQAGLIRHGRVDICAQSPEDLRRWLLGREPWPNGTQDPNVILADATAFDAGFLNSASDVATNPNDPSIGDRPLWERLGSALGTNDPDVIRTTNLRRHQSAVAGLITRVQAETEVPLLPRSGADAGIEPEDALMDLSGVLASRCSAFEVAWSDGTRARRNFTAPGNVEYRIGDIIWFDRTFTRRDLQQTFPTDYAPIPPADPEILANERNTRLNLASGGGFVSGGYDWFASGGDDEEYLAVWGYQVPDQRGGYEGAWRKPQLLRFRLTLHDSQFRIPGGKQFEFIVSIEAE